MMLEKSLAPKAGQSRSAATGRKRPVNSGQIEAFETPLSGKQTWTTLSRHVPNLNKLAFSAGGLPDSVRHCCDSKLKNVRGRLQPFTNKQLVTRLQT